MEANGRRVLSLAILILVFSSASVQSKITEQTYKDVQEKYGILWDSLQAVERSLWDIESQPCEKDKDCYKYFQNLDTAFEIESDIPSKPYCVVDRTTSEESGEAGYCTCGIGRCESYSRNWENGDVFYYCGPCGWVGAECTMNHTCTHSMATCSNDYCECVHDGIFYNMAFCYMPYYGKRMITQMFISTAIIVALCGVLAYSYHRLSGSRRQELRRFANWRRSTTVRESPPDDTPPTYDDVVEKVPSYQDAIEMEKTNGDGKGLNNPAFEDDYTLPPAYDESFKIKIEEDIIANNEENIIVQNATGPEEIVTKSHSDSPPEEQSRTLEAERQPIEQPLEEALNCMKTKTSSPTAQASPSLATDTEGQCLQTQL